MQPDHPAAVFVLQPGSDRRSPRWVLGPPVDRHGDGLFPTAASELHDDGLSAVLEVHVDGNADDDRLVRLSEFVEALARDWQGWEGVRCWRSLHDELFLDARHDGRGRVSLGVTLGCNRPSDVDRWSARAVFRIEAGEELSGVAAQLADALDARPTPDGP